MYSRHGTGSSGNLSHFSHRVTGSLHGHQCDPVYHPVSVFFVCDICVVFSLYSVNNHKSSVSYYRSTGRLVTLSPQQHNRFLNNVQYSPSSFQTNRLSLCLDYFLKFAYPVDEIAVVNSANSIFFT